MATSISTRLAILWSSVSLSVSSIFLVSGTSGNVGFVAFSRKKITQCDVFQPSLSSPSSSVCSSFSSFAVLIFCVVILITGLILCGLIVDLGGGPDRKRLGFKVSKSLEVSFQRPDLDV